MNSKTTTQTLSSMLETAKAEEPVLLRDKDDKRLHIVDRTASKIEDKAVNVPEAWTEVIGWHAGKQIVRLRPVPEC